MAPPALSVLTNGWPSFPQLQVTSSYPQVTLQTQILDLERYEHKPHRAIP